MKIENKANAGDAFAHVGQQRHVKMADGIEPSGPIERKLVEMKNITEKPDSSSAAVPVQTAVAPAQELFDPQEWEALLNSFETENTTAPKPVARTPEEPQVDLSADDLWERLSSTRWIRTPGADSGDSTVAKRAEPL